MRWVAKSSVPSGSPSVSSEMTAADVGLAHPQLDLLVEDRQHRHRVRQHWSAAPGDVDRQVEGLKAADATTPSSSARSHPAAAR
jgi:hypothetical protein